MKSLCLILCLCAPLISCARAQEAVKPLEQGQTVSDLTLKGIFARHALTKAVSGSFRDTVTRLDDSDAEESNVLNISFWLERPNKYHFRVQEKDSEDSQHYVSNGVDRWEVEVVLDSEIIDKKQADDQNPFARIQQLMHLDEAGLRKDFQWSGILPRNNLAEFKELALPESWMKVVILIPHSPEMRSEVKRVVLAFSESNDLAGLLIDDSHGNRRLVEITTVEEHENLDPSFFTWGER